MHAWQQKKPHSHTFRTKVSEARWINSLRWLLCTATLSRFSTYIDNTHTHTFILYAGRVHCHLFIKISEQYVTHTQVFGGNVTRICSLSLSHIRFPGLFEPASRATHFLCVSRVFYFIHYSYSIHCILTNALPLLRYFYHYSSRVFCCSWVCPTSLSRASRCAWLGLCSCCFFHTFSASICNVYFIYDSLYVCVTPFILIYAYVRYFMWKYFRSFHQHPANKQPSPLTEFNRTEQRKSQAVRPNRDKYCQWTRRTFPY